MRQKLNRGEYSSAADELLKWVHSGGIRLNGLVKRRALERLVFLNEVNLYLPSYRRAKTRDNMQEDKDDIKHYGSSITGIIASSIKGLFGRFKGVAPALGHK